MAPRLAHVSNSRGALELLGFIWDADAAGLE